MKTCTKAELETIFIVYPSLLHPEVEKIPIIPHSDFASPLTPRVTDRMHDEIYLLQASIMMIASSSPLSRYLGEKSSLVKFVGGQH